MIIFYINDYKTQLFLLSTQDISSFLQFLRLEDAGRLEPRLRYEAVVAAVGVSTGRVCIAAHVRQDPIFAAVSSRATRLRVVHILLFALEDVLLLSLLKSLSS